MPCLSLYFTVKCGLPLPHYLNLNQLSSLPMNIAKRRYLSLHLIQQSGSIWHIWWIFPTAIFVSLDNWDTVFFKCSSYLIVHFFSISLLTAFIYGCLRNLCIPGLTSPPSSLFSCIQSFIISSVCTVLCLATQSCLTLCNPMDCSPPGSSVHETLQARTLEWVAMPSSMPSILHSSSSVTKTFPNIKFIFLHLSEHFHL